MPSPSDFRRGFGLEEGMTFGSFTLIKAHVGHEVREFVVHVRYLKVIVQNERYCFPSTFHFRTNDGSNVTDQQVQELLALLRKHTGGKRIIYSAFGSPYECTITKIAVKARQGAEVIIAATGLAVRRHDIPTKAQEQRAKEQQQQAAGIHAAVDMNDPEVKKQLEPYRVIKSRFGSGKCSICGGRIEQGEWIAKRKDDTSRGGWSHVACVLALAGKQQREDEPAEARSEDVTRASRAKQRGEAQHNEEAAEAKQKGGVRTSRGKRQGAAAQHNPEAAEARSEDVTRASRAKQRGEAQHKEEAAEAKPEGGMRRSRRKREGELKQEEPSKKQKVERRTAAARSTRGGEAAQPGGDTRLSNGKRQADEKEQKARHKQQVRQHAETTRGSRGGRAAEQRGEERTSTATARSTLNKTAQRAEQGTTPRSGRKREPATDNKKAQGQSKKGSSDA